jgi:broad specificity phosphatase PhoE
MFNRAKKFLEKIKIKHENQIILIVSHNGINKAIISAINHTGPEGIPKIQNMANDEIKEFKIN